MNVALEIITVMREALMNSAESDENKSKTSRVCGILASLLIKSIEL